MGLFKSLSVVSFFTLLSRLLGLVREMVIAAKFGAGASTDALFVAFQICYEDYSLKVPSPKHSCQYWPSTESERGMSELNY